MAATSVPSPTYPKHQLRLRRKIFWLRSVVATILLSALLAPRVYQPALDLTYAWLLHSSIYKSSTFETFWTVFLYACVEVSYTYLFGHNPDLRLVNRYPSRGENDETANFKPIPKLHRPSKRLGEAVTYVAPLLTLDLTMIKKFGGVPVEDMARSGNYDPATVGMRGHFLAPSLHNFSWISPLQTQRALPPLPPSSRQLVVQLIVSLWIYDAVFFFFHLALHKVPGVRSIHGWHHRHEEINPQVTNQLDVIERLGLVLLANFSLNIIKSHVLTRTLFVPLFVWLLVDIHSGMDLACGYDKLLPNGWAAGSKRHSVHHKYGQKYYEPFFNWWDDLYEYMRKR